MEGQKEEKHYLRNEETRLEQPHSDRPPNIYAYIAIYVNPPRQM
jgi:hypothetical protein